MFNEYPYTNLTDVNLDFILKHIKDLETNLQDFIKLNTIKYANPIDWNISKQYEANTVVVNEFTGVAYLSTKPVPAGVDVTNTDYWTPIFTLDFVNMNKNITLRNDGNNNNATFESSTGDWLIVGGQLYKVIQDIALHTAYVVGYNIEVYSVELFVKDYLNHVLDMIGSLQELNTSDKTSVVNAINSLVAVIGDLQRLDTEDKTSVVNAINEVVTLINVHSNVIGSLSDLHTEDKSNLVNAINENVKNITSINEKLSNEQIINVANYPRLEGETDDTNRINRALADCGGSNDITGYFYDMNPCKVLYFPAGVYIVSQPIFINKNNVTIVGEGQYNTIIRASDTVSIDSVIKCSEAYGLTIKNIQLDGACPINDDSFNYGAESLLWLDQCAYVTIRDVILGRGRYQGMRVCHLWESYFSNLSILYVGMGGEAYGGNALRLAVGIYFSTHWKISNFFPGAESNEIKIDKLSLSGMYGCSIWIDQMAPVANIYFDGVIEENALFNWLGTMPSKMSEPCWHIYGQDTDVSINDHYVYEHSQSTALNKDVYDISSATNVSIKHCTIMNNSPTGKVSPYGAILRNQFQGNIEVDITVRDYSLDFNSEIIHNNNLYGANYKSRGRIAYLGGLTMNDDNSKTPASLINDINLFFGTVYISNSTGGTVYEHSGTSF